MTKTTKWCSGCQQRKPEPDWYPSMWRSTSGGYCRTCHSAYNKGSKPRETRRNYRKRTMENVVQDRTKTLAALAALTNWMREHTGRNDEGVYDMLCDAVKVLKAEGVETNVWGEFEVKGEPGERAAS